MHWARFWILVGATATVSTMVTTIYLHRGLAHLSFKMSRPYKFIMRSLLWLTTTIIPKEWVAVHRKHHAFTDIEGDPHSPILEGYWKIMLENSIYYYREAKAQKEAGEFEKYSKGILWTRVDNHPKLGMAIYAAVLAIICSFTEGSIVLGLIFGILVPVIAVAIYVFVLSSSINALTHVWGRKKYKKSPAFNIWWLSFPTGGEAWHNNHHQFPSSPRLAIFDIAWPIILASSWLRLIKLRESPKKIRKRLQAPIGGL